MQSIAIVGGGIGGLASAILLSRKGFQVTVFDKAPSPQPVGAGFLLQPPGQAVLNELGALDKILETAVPIYKLQSQTLSGRQLLDLHYHRLSENARHGLGVQRSTIYDALLSQATAAKELHFVWNSAIKSCTEENNTVKITAKDTEYSFDLCILASGSNSHLAEPHFKKRIKRPYGWGCLWTTIALPASMSPNVLHQRCQTSRKMMGILPVRKEQDGCEAALYWSMKSSDLAALDEAKIQTIKKEIMLFWPAASASVAALNHDNFIAAQYNDIWTAKPFSNRIIAIGDVSHATSPQLGQGCTMALLDAWHLAHHLANQSENMAHNLENWWRSRRSQLMYVRYLSRFLTPLFQSESKMCEVIRDYFIAPIGRLSIVDKIQLKTLASEILLTPNGPKLK